MLTTKPCKATCVVDGAAVQISFYPDTGVLRVADAARASVRETFWGASWQELLDAFSQFNQQPANGSAMAPDFLSHLAYAQ